MWNKNSNILIVGLGLIGGSYAMALHEKGYTVHAIDTDPSAISFGLEKGFLKSGSTIVDEQMVRDADLIIFGLYPRALIDWIRAHQNLFSSGTLITDVSGVKTGVVDVIQSFLREDVEFVSSHPMAGKETSGVTCADPSIFSPANFIITPTSCNSSQGIAAIWHLAEELGFGHITQLSISDHDEMIGYLSQLTHVIAVCLMNGNDNTHLSEYTGDSFRDLTRIAKINEKLWSELFFMNKRRLVEEIDAFAHELSSIKNAILEENRDALEEKFIQSTIRRKAFDRVPAEKKHF